jgi:hypothetical protein
MNLVAARVLAAGSQSGASLLGLRLLLAVGVLLLLVATVGYLRQAWRRRATRQEEDLPELLGPPHDPGTVLAAPLRGAYLGTTDAGHWLEWFSASGLDGRDGSYISVYETGVRVDRRGSAFWIPREAVRGARLERGHAGKVATPGRLLVIAWSLAGRELETGFRGEDRSRQPKVARSVHELIGPAPAGLAEGEITAPRPMMVAGTLRRLRSRRHPLPGPDGAGAPRSRGHGGHHLAGSARRAMPRRRENSRTLQQEIADRRGADPYGTGPRAVAPPGVDPYVTNPRGVPYGPGPGMRATPPTGPRGPGVRPPRAGRPDDYGRPTPPGSYPAPPARPADPYATPRPADPYRQADPYAPGQDAYGEWAGGDGPARPRPRQRRQEPGQPEQ